MDAVAVLSVVAALFAWGLAAIVLAFSPKNRVNRALAVFFVLVGVIQLTSVNWPLPPSVGLMVFLVTIPSASFIAPSYLFVVASLETPVVARFKTRAARRAVLAIAAFAAALAFGIIGYGILTGLTTAQHNAPFIDAFVGVYFVYITLAILATAVFALVATVSAFRRAPAGSLARSRARAWLVAFGTQDSFLVLAGITNLIGSARDATGATNNFFDQAQALLFPAAIVVSVPLLAYGIAKTQLFDIDVRIKWGAARGAVTAFLVAVFFVVEKLVEVYASRLLGVTFGAIAAGLMLFFVPRLNRAADRVADKAAPAVKPTSEYLSFKKLEVYRAAVESAFEEGGGRIDERGRGILSRLRTKLQLSEPDASAVESEVVGAPSSAVT